MTMTLLASPSPQVQALLQTGSEAQPGGLRVGRVLVAAKRLVVLESQTSAHLCSLTCFAFRTQK